MTKYIQSIHGSNIRRKDGAYVDSILSIRFSQDDKQLLREVAARLRRSKSDTVRVLIRQAAADLRKTDRILPIDLDVNAARDDQQRAGGNGTRSLPTREAS